MPFLSISDWLLLLQVGFLFFYCLDNPLDWKNLTWLGKSVPAGAARIAALSALFFIAVLLSRAARKHYERVYFTSWWDPSDKAPGNPLSWKNVKEIIQIRTITAIPPQSNGAGKRHHLDGNEIDLLDVCNAEKIDYCFSEDATFDNDPVWYKRKPRHRVLGECVRDVVAIGLVVAAFMAAAFLVLADFQFLKPILKEISIPGAVLTAIGGGIMAVLRLSANVRSKNRQEWINEIRNLLGEIIDGIGRYRSREITHNPYRTYQGGPQTEQAKIFRDLNSKRIKLEMMLNPSEIEHRALMMLIRTAFGMNVPNVDAFSIACLQLQDDLRCYSGGGDEKDLISKIIRLSHVVLKREWERVKYAQ